MRFRNVAIGLAIVVVVAFVFVVPVVTESRRPIVAHTHQTGLSRFHSYGLA